MKSFVGLLGLIALALAQEPETCSVCQQGTEVLFAALAAEESVVQQIQLITDVGCPNLPDPAGCSVGVETWWPRMAAAVYTDELAAWTCHELDVSCELPSSFIWKAWNCNTCMADVRAVSAVGQTPETGAMIVDTLQGPAFCQAEDLALNADQVAVCQGYVSRIDLAFNLIFDAVGDSAREICVELYQICDA